MLAKYFSQDLSTHAYGLGDLDDLYWPRTTYWGEIQGKEASRVTLLYRGEGLPVLLALGSADAFDESYYRILTAQLPANFYAHLSPGLEKRFSEDYQIIDHGEHYKMSLINPGALGDSPPANTIRLDSTCLPELQELYDLSYPDNAFDPGMLSTGKYYGCRVGGVLVSAAGVHVYSFLYRVAALGNITTHPEHRNQGYARLASSSLCHDLLEEVDFIGLNVKADNLPAIRLYQSLGFEIASKYGEFSLKKRF